MFKYLLFPLVDQFGFFNIFQYISFRAIYGAVTSLVIAWLLGPKVIATLKRLKLGQIVREDGPESHFKKRGTPTMGGVFILAAVLISVLLWQDLNSFTVWLLTISLVGFGLIGFIDDYLKNRYNNSKGLRARFKLIGQIIVAAVIGILLLCYPNEETFKLYIPFVKYSVLDLSSVVLPSGYVLNLAFIYPIFVIVILVGASNAVNLTDGLDGLATGLLLIAFTSFAVIAYLSGRADFAEYLLIPYIPGGGEVTIPIFAMIGALLGFLWFNTNPAQIFMGDTGSLSLGGGLATLALIFKKEVLLLILGGVFVWEALSVIIQVLVYRKTKKRVFLMSPIHHHYEKKGWKESTIVVRFWILGMLFAFIALSSLKIR